MAERYLRLFSGWFNDAIVNRPLARLSKHDMMGVAKILLSTAAVC